MNYRTTELQNYRTTPKKSTILSCLIHFSVYIFTALSLSAPASLAQQSPAAGSNTSASTELRQYNIPAQPLSEALIEFGKQSGLQVTTGSALVEGKQAPSVSGTLSAEQALNQLLAGNDLRYEVNGGMVRLVANTETTALPSVRIGAQGLLGTADSAYRVESATINMLGEKTIKDIPYSIESFSQALIKNKQARSLADMAKGDASINLMRDNLVAENNSVAIRGIANDNFTGHRIDGLVTRSRGSDLPLEHMEQVDILKGASGFLYGFGRPGGIINYVLKKPTDHIYRSLNAQAMDSGLTLVHGDIGGRLGANDRFGYRMNILHESGDTYIDDGESRRNSGSIALDWKITADLTWRVDALAGEHMRRGGYSILVSNLDGAAGNFKVAGQLEPINGSRRLAPSWSFYRSTHEIYGTDLSWSFATNWSLNLAYRYSENGRVGPYTRIFSDSANNYSLSSSIGQRNLYKNIQSQVVISGIFTTGPISHELAAGTANTKIHQEVVSPSDRLKGVPYRLAIPNIGNLSNPVEWNNPFYSFSNYNPYWYKKVDTTEFWGDRHQELFLSDTLHLGGNWDIILGLRHSSLNHKFRFGARSRYYEESAVTPTLAAVFRPLDGLSLYGSYVEALERGAEAPNTANNAGQVFPPLTSKQYEFGAKAEYVDWSASAALFQIEKGLTYTTAANIFTQDGEARYQGLEINGKFRFSRRWLLTTSAVWLNATNQQTTGGTLDNKHISGVARKQVNLYTEYRMRRIPLTLTSGARYVGKRPLDPNNRWYLGDVTLFDLGARYETKLAGQRLTLRFNIDNLTDEAYWLTTVGSAGFVSQGLPRTFKLGVEIEF